MSSLGRAFRRVLGGVHFSKGKMENSLGTVCDDVFGEENLFMLDDFNEKFLDLVEVS